MKVSSGAAILAALVMAASLGKDAAAQSAADAMRQWGLLGTWAVDCRKPAGYDNLHLTFSERGGQAEIHYDAGSRTGTSPILAARILSDGSLEISITDTDGVHINVLIKDGDNRMRPNAARSPSGETTLRDGRYAADGSAAPWAMRCRRGQ